MSDTAAVGTEASCIGGWFPRHQATLDEATKTAIRNGNALRTVGSIERFLAAGEVELAEQSLATLRLKEEGEPSRYGAMLLAEVGQAVAQAVEAEVQNGGRGSLLVPGNPFRKARLAAMAPGL